MLKTGVIKWRLKLYGRFWRFLTFSKTKNMTFCVVAHVFSNTGVHCGIRCNAGHVFDLPTTARVVAVNSTWIGWRRASNVQSRHTDLAVTSSSEYRLTV